MSIHQPLDTTVLASATGGGSVSVVLVIGLALVVAFLLSALSASAGDMARVTAVAVGGFFRIVGSMLVVVVLLGLLIFVMVGGSPRTAAGAPPPTVSTDAPGQEGDAPNPGLVPGPEVPPPTGSG